MSELPDKSSRGALKTATSTLSSSLFSQVAAPFASQIYWRIADSCLVGVGIKVHVVDPDIQFAGLLRSHPATLGPLDAAP
jgi:hypothetical protein